MSFSAPPSTDERRRTKNKDAYDVVWLAESWPGGQSELAAEIMASSLVDELSPMLKVLGEEFSDIDAAGAVKYGRFMATDSAAVDIFARRAVGAIRALLVSLNR